MKHAAYTDHKTSPMTQLDPLQTPLERRFTSLHIKALSGAPRLSSGKF